MMKITTFWNLKYLESDQYLIEIAEEVRLFITGQQPPTTAYAGCTGTNQKLCIATTPMCKRTLVWTRNGRCNGRRPIMTMYS
jgi:hypothetical protein